MSNETSRPPWASPPPPPAPAGGQRDFAAAEFYLWKLDDPAFTGEAERIVAALRAVAHSQLAVTAVTALRGMNDLPAPEYTSWRSFLAERAAPPPASN